MFINSVVKSSAENIYRILWISAEKNLIITIQLNIKTSTPSVYEYSDWVSQLDANELQIIVDPYLQLRTTINPTEKQKHKRDEAWNIIADLVSKEPDIYFKKEKRLLIKKAVQCSNKSERTIYNYLAAYWQRGKCKNALLPSYDKSGAPGVERKSGTKKRGRPSKYQSSTSFNITELDKKNILSTLRKYYLTGDKESLAYVYNKLKCQYYAKTNEDTGEEELVEPYPTIAQFLYWKDKLLDATKIAKRREGEIFYQKEMRPILSTTASQVSGPGAVYEIDATIADVYLISQTRRKEIVGRPTIYFVTDVFSRMITGFYVGFENASWQTACLALTTALVDKVELCKNIGINISYEQWPSVGLPQAILGDGAEMKSFASNVLSDSFAIEIKNTPPYRADWKPVVESKFKVIQQKFKPYVESYVHKNFNPRLDKDYRLDACLDINFFTKIILTLVLEYNNKHSIDSYDMSADMIADGVKPVPIEMWNWGVQNRSGVLRQEDPELVRLKLLPTAPGSITRYGVYFQHCYYKADDAKKNSWFEKGILQGKKCSVAYDTRDLSCVYFKSTLGEFIKAHLTDKSRGYNGLSLREIQQLYFFKQDQKAEHKPIEATSNLNTDNLFENLVKEAKSLLPDVSNLSKASRVANIADNKKTELRGIRKEENIHNQPALQIVESKDNSVNKSDDEFQVPSRTAKLRNKKKEENKPDD